MHAKAQRESIVSIARTRSISSTATGGTGEISLDGARGDGGSDVSGKLVSLADISQEKGRNKPTGGAGAGEDGGSTESGSVGIVRLGSFANLVQGAEGTRAGDDSSHQSGSIGMVTLGSLAGSSSTGKGPVILETEETGATERAAAEGQGSDQGACAGGSSLESFTKSDVEIVSPRNEAARGSEGGHNNSDQRGSVGIVRLGSFASGDIDTGPTAVDDAERAEETAAKRPTTMARTGEGVTVQKVDGNAQGAHAGLIRLGTFARRNTRIGRVNQNLRKNQRRRRKAHHYLMSLTHSGLKPGMDYHIRVAGVSSVGQVQNVVSRLVVFGGADFMHEGV